MGGGGCCVVAAEKLVQICGCKIKNEKKNEKKRDPFGFKPQICSVAATGIWRDENRKLFYCYKVDFAASKLPPVSACAIANKRSKRSDDSQSIAKWQNSSWLFSKVHTSCTKHTVLDLSNVCRNHGPLHYSGQESQNNLQFIVLTYLWPWNKVTKSSMNCYTPSKIIIKQSLRDLS